jgi:hypothetical protein
MNATNPFENLFHRLTRAIESLNNKKVTGGSQSGQLTTGQTSNANVSLQKQFDTIRNYTVTVDISPPDVVSNADTTEVVTALVTVHFFNNGNWITRKFHTSTSQSIACPAEAVNVVVTDATPIGGGAGIAGKNYTVNITVAEGNRPSFSQPCLLAANTPFAIVASGSQVVQVPQNAGIVSVLPLFASNTAGQHPVANLAFRANTSIIAVVDTAQEGGFIAIPPGTTNILILNEDVANALNANLLFGVDG